MSCKILLNLRKVSLLITFFFVFNTVSPSLVLAQNVLDLPKPSTMVRLSSPQMVNFSQSFEPVVLKGIKVDPNDPLKLNFLVNVGQSNLTEDEFEDESNKLVRYFLTALTVPDKDLWVNLSPYEKNRIIADKFSLTEMGRDLLAQDYLLKQITATAMYPESQLGKDFWDKVYRVNLDIPKDILSKVWIVPDEATVYVDKSKFSAVVVSSHLKVLTEEEYTKIAGGNPVKSLRDHGTASQVLKEVIVPAIEREVNTGANFSQLRQVYQSLILATWYKHNLKKSLLGEKYVGKNKVAGVNLVDQSDKQVIYDQYIESFKKGAYDYVKEEYDPITQTTIPRKYFSGGVDMVDWAMMGDTYREITDAAMADDSFAEKQIVVNLIPSSGVVPSDFIPTQEAEAKVRKMIINTKSATYFNIDVSLLFWMNTIIGKRAANVLFKVFREELGKFAGQYSESVLWRRGGDEFSLVLSNLDDDKKVKFKKFVEDLSKIEFSVASLGRDVVLSEAAIKRIHDFSGDISIVGHSTIVVFPKFNISQNSRDFINGILNTIKDEHDRNLVVVPSWLDNLSKPNTLSLRLSIGVSDAANDIVDIENPEHKQDIITNAGAESILRKLVSISDVRRMESKKGFVLGKFNNVPDIIYKGDWVINTGKWEEMLKLNLDHPDTMIVLKNIGLFDALRDESRFDLVREEWMGEHIYYADSFDAIVEALNRLSQEELARALVIQCDFSGYSHPKIDEYRQVHAATNLRDSRIDYGELKILNEVFGEEGGDIALSFIRHIILKSAVFKERYENVIVTRGPPAGPSMLLIPKKGLELSKEQIKADVEYLLKEVVDAFNKFFEVQILHATAVFGNIINDTKDSTRVRIGRVLERFNAQRQYMSKYELGIQVEEFDNKYVALWNRMLEKRAERAVLDMNKIMNGDKAVLTLSTNVLRVNKDEGTPVGGIDFNPAMMNLKEQGYKAQMNMTERTLGMVNANYQGFYPTITDVQSVSSVEKFLTSSSK
ncbi:MAG: hypothetical protein HQL25_03390 [Candidatus Omnitrophica bacterium]|nr:hypothetical protein [Candidatus Omnitrophota bacterium]